MIKKLLINLLFSLAFSRKFGIIKPKERYKFLTQLNIRDFKNVIDHEQKILQDLYFKKDNIKNRYTFKGGYLALEKLRLEAETAKQKYFQQEAIEKREEESVLENQFDNID